MNGSEKQVAWANQIIARYMAAKEAVEAKIAGLPAANAEKINAALDAIDAKIVQNNSAADIISRGSVYFPDDNLGNNTKSLMDAIRRIASGSSTVLDQA